MHLISVLFIAIFTALPVYAGCYGKDDCYQNLEGYCRIAYPVEPVTSTSVVIEFVTETTTTTTTETYVGVRSLGNVQYTALQTAPATPAQTTAIFSANPTPVQGLQRPSAVLKSLCSCIQDPTTAIIATTVTSTTTETSTATTTELYCKGGCLRGVEYCDTSAASSKPQPLLAGTTPTAKPARAFEEPELPDGLCRPTSSCDNNDDCISKKKKQSCECLQDSTDLFPNSPPGYCINSKARKCDDNNGFPLDQDSFEGTCQTSQTCPERYVCLKLCQYGPYKHQGYCVNPIYFTSVCDAQQDPGEEIFSQGRDRPQSFLSFDRFGAKRDLRKRN